MSSHRPAPESPIFGDAFPYRNPIAGRAYQISIYGLLPVVGLVLGPIAIVGGWVGARRFHADPTIKGLAPARAGMILGTASFLSNLAGTYCLYRGWTE